MKGFCKKVVALRKALSIFDDVYVDFNAESHCIRVYSKESEGFTGVKIALCLEVVPVLYLTYIDNDVIQFNLF